MKSLYEEDFHAWTQEQSRRIRDGGEIDREHVAEEIASLGRSEQARLERHFELYLMHRLKWEYQPEYRTRSWALTMKEQQRRAVQLVTKNPSLKPLVSQIFADAFEGARVLALNETGLDEEEIPETNTFDLADCFPELA